MIKVEKIQEIVVQNTKYSSYSITANLTILTLVSLFSN